jgi:RHS protein
MRTHDDAGSGLVRYSFYSPEMNLIAETEPSTSATHWTFTDHLGTPQLQTNAGGAVDWRVEYEPYGSVIRGDHLR